MQKNIGIIFKCFLFFGVIFYVAPLTAQTHDTLSIYKKIKKVTSKHKFTQLLYDAIFVDPAPQQYENKPLSDHQKEVDPNLKYEGKYIRNITVQVLDPFGYSISDTNKSAINTFQKFADKYHVKTKHFIIKNLLLIKQNEQFDLHKFNESERLLRSADYVNDAQMFIYKLKTTGDSIDIKVMVQDKWTLDGNINLSFSSVNGTLSERNVAGLGQKFVQYGSYDANSGNYANNGNYIINNIKKTYITSNIFYTTNQHINATVNSVTSAGFALDRPFYTTLTKWAGGITESYTWTSINDSVEKVYQTYNVENVFSDVWLGRSFNPGFGAPVNRKGTNIIFAFRYLDNHYQLRPEVKNDSSQKYFNSSMALGSVALSLRKYYKDRFIYRFGANEDIPEGGLIQILAGAKYLELTGLRYYSGFQLSYGSHLDQLGYLSMYLNYGTFYNENIHNNGTMNFGFYYFSDLLQSNKWYFRQFIYLKYVNGINKSKGETITLNPDELYGFDNGTLTGTKKMIVNFESVTYVPYNVIGFKFAPLLLFGFGMIENNEHQFLNSPIYQAYALGVLIRNENLLNSSFQITYGIYPNLPDNNRTFMRFNPNIGFSIKVPIFTVTKPSIVDYR